MTCFRLCAFSAGDLSEEKNKFRSLKKKTGFTLMEILVAILILGIIMAAVLGTFTGMISGSRIAEKKTEIDQTGRTVMELISGDIRGIFSQDMEGGGLFFVGLTESVEGKSMSRMEFVTTNSLHIGNRKNPFMTEVGYGVKKNAEGDLYSLWRRSQSPPEPPYGEGGNEVPVCRIVEKFELAFIIGNDKQESLMYRIPDGVVIRMTLNLDGERETFQTMVRPMVSIGGH